MVVFAAALVAFCIAVPFDERRAEAELDVVTLVDGRTHTGQLVYADEMIVVLRNRTRERSFPRDEIEDVDSRVASLHQLLQRLDEAGPLSRQTPEALLELGSFAEHSRLPGEARVLRLLALLADPDHEMVNKTLGNKRRNKSWTTRRGRSWVKTSKLTEPGEKWKDRWTLDTAHYRVSTNLPLGDALAAALDLERLYRSYFELLSIEVGLREPREIMEVQLHADDKSFPEPGSGRKGVFVPDDRIAYVNVSRRPWNYQLAHEATRQLLYVTTQRAVNAKGEVPRWLDAGLSEAFASGMTGRPGQMNFDPWTVDKLRYGIHGRAHKAFDLRRVMVFSDDDLNIREMQGLRYAQCYTLVDYLMQGDASEYRSAFFDFLRLPPCCASAPFPISMPCRSSRDWPTRRESDS